MFGTAALTPSVYIHTGDAVMADDVRHDAAGLPFIDRDPSAFEEILNYMLKGKKRNYRQG